MKKRCKYCGAEYEGDPGSSACRDCVAKNKMSTLRPRQCRECGCSFMGGPRAWYCPTCRDIRQKEADRRFKRNGPQRPIGSTDLCECCGQPYTVNSARQRYCKECAPGEVRKACNELSRRWNEANVTPEERREIRKAANVSGVCVICGKEFSMRPAATTCSAECSAELHRRNAAEWERANKERRNAYHRELYRKKKQQEEKPPET